MNIFQRILLDFFKDYDMSVHYHLTKVNVVEDDLSRLFIGSVAHVKEERKELTEDVCRIACLGIHLMSISYNSFTFKNGLKILFVNRG